ncbi:hypothetical protein NA57DRAFT_20470, partial [Rhizodiscina lignyota]
MDHPFQCLRARDDHVLFAACGSNIYSVSLTDGSIISKWPTCDPPTPKDEKEPPGKHRKLDSNSTTPPANVTILTLASERQHLVAVTAEDKYVHVFEISQDGQLSHISQRQVLCIRIRPSSIVVTSDDSSILVADKFGDVYSLPLLPAHEQEPSVPTSVEEQEKQAPKTYKPAATSLTVHSARNLRALEQQMKRVNEPAKIKEPLKFAHKLLLGHVSMVTDVLFASVSHGLGKREYIITADRDEHIRVSRRPPSQAHIIEGYCLGHKSFVSKLCMVTPQLLVSGGGDDYLYVWKWQDFQLRRKVSIREWYQKVVQERSVSNGVVGPSSDVRNAPLTVSGLWTVSNVPDEHTHLVVALEGFPALMCFTVAQLEDQVGDIDIKTMYTPGNVLDVANLGDTLLISVDNLHAPGSTENSPSN